MAAVRNAIAEKYSDVVVEPESTETTTSWLEVYVNGKLVHSKKNGDGVVNTKEKLKKIIDAVDAMTADKKTTKTVEKTEEKKEDKKEDTLTKK